MATTLFVITNSKLNGKETENDWKKITDKLNIVAKNSSDHIYSELRKKRKNSDWEYEIINRKDLPFHVEFNSFLSIDLELYSNIGIIYTCYKYRYLYTAIDFDDISSFREDLFETIKVIGGTEAIYLADNGCDKLSDFLVLAQENISYEVIKEKMISELGNPITDYAKLYFEKLDYHNINEFFLDNLKI